MTRSHNRTPKYVNLTLQCIKSRSFFFSFFFLGEKIKILTKAIKSNINILLIIIMSFEVANSFPQSEILVKGYLWGHLYFNSHLLVFQQNYLRFKFSYRNYGRIIKNKNKRNCFFFLETEQNFNLKNLLIKLIETHKFVQFSIIIFEYFIKIIMI